MARLVPPLVGSLLLPRDGGSVHLWPKKSAAGTKHKDQGQMMSRSRRESGKEGSPAITTRLPLSLSSSTQLFYAGEREGEK